jgi:arginine/ornithine N-succinyltransferase beta subunit
VHLGEADPVPDTHGNLVTWLVANRKFDAWRCILAAAPRRIDRFPLLPYAADALGIGEGELVRAVPLSPRDR